MEGEINNFIMVWTFVILATNYCYGVSKIVPKGMHRLMAILPVVCLFMVLPLNLNSIHLGCVTFFYISWIANSKLILLSFGLGPLSDPSLQIPHFMALACLPIKLQKSLKTKPPEKNEPKNGLQSPSHYVQKLLFLGFLLFAYTCRESLHPSIVMLLVVIYLYIGLELLLAVPGVIIQLLLGLEMEQPFNHPYLSSSLQDFWGRRWNIISTDVLRSTIFSPILHYVSRKYSPYLALIAAVMSSFFVSALMHELIFYHICRVGPTWGSTLFFFVQGLCLVVEVALKRKLGISWRLPRLVTGPIIFVFMISTFVWLVMPIVVQFDIVNRVVDEYAALGEFALDFVLASKEKCCYLLINYLQLQSSTSF